MTTEPPTPPTAEEVALARRTILWEGIFSRFMDALTGGVFLAGIALFLGASTFVVALIAALPFLAQVAQVPSVGLLMRARNRRPIVVTASSAARSLLFVVALLVWLVPGRFDAWTLFGILALGSLATVVSTGAWNWWMRDLLPRSELGRYFGRRLQITATIAALAIPVAGFGLDWFSARGETHLGYALLFLLGGAAGLTSSLIISLTPHRPAPRAPAVPNPFRALADPLRDPQNRRLAVALMLVTATLTILFPFTAVYMIRSLEYSFALISVLALVSQFAYVGSLHVWGNLSDRFGNVPILLISVGMVVVSLVGWTFTWGGTDFALFLLLWVLHFLAGFAVAGIELAMQNVLLKTAPEVGAPAYLASLSMARALVAGLATIGAGALWTVLGSGTVFEIGIWGESTWTIRGFHALGLVAVLVGLGALLALRKFQEPGRAPVLEVARAMRREVRMLSSVAGIRAFVHAVSYVVEFFVQERTTSARLERRRVRHEERVRKPIGERAGEVEPPGRE